MAQIRPASTVLLLQDTTSGPEVFLVRRHERAPFMGGAYVFPGGAVDKADDTVDDSWCDGLPASDAAFRVAALRELFEEAGVLMVGHDVADQRERLVQSRRDLHDHLRSFRDVVTREQLRLALHLVVPSAHWVTPPVADGRRFDTHFFVARMPKGQDARHDERETIDSVWLTPSHAIEQAAANRIVLPPPTWTSLREIRDLDSVDAIISWAAARRIDRREPILVEDDGVRMLIMPGDRRHPDRAGVSAVPETCFVWHGDRWHPERSA